MEESKLGPLPTVHPVEFDASACDRLNCQFAMIHEHCGADPIQAQAFSSVVLEYIEQPYVRRVPKVPDGWIEIDLGWFKSMPEKIGHIVIQNTSGQFPQSNPTDEEKERLKRSIIFISCSPSKGAEWTVGPGAPPFVGCPTFIGQNIYVRGDNQPSMLITIFPC